MAVGAWVLGEVGEGRVDGENSALGVGEERGQRQGGEEFEGIERHGGEDSFCRAGVAGGRGWER